MTGKRSLFSSNIAQGSIDEFKNHHHDVHQLSDDLMIKA